MSELVRKLIKFEIKLNLEIKFSFLFSLFALVVSDLKLNLKFIMQVRLEGVLILGSIL